MKGENNVPLVERAHVPHLSSNPNARNEIRKLKK
jgi:hypothetical protein